MHRAPAALRWAAITLVQLALLIGSVAPASAQNVQRRPRPWPPRPEPYLQELPPEPLGPRSLGLLERDFQAMRATSPNPDAFAQGRWNPRFQLVVPYSTGGFGYPLYGGGIYYNGGGYYPNGGGYYPNGGGYPGYGFGGFYPQQFPNERVYIERQLIVTPQAQGAAPAAAPLAPAPRQPESYYLHPPQPRDDGAAQSREESLTEALAGIRQAWLNGDMDRLQRYLPPDGQVRLFPGGRYAYSLTGAEFAALTRDAMTRMDTTGFTLGPPTMRGADIAFVGGQHAFRIPAAAAEQGAAPAPTTKAAVYISYLLQRVDGRWRIVEAGSSTTPIAAHAQ